MPLLLCIDSNQLPATPPLPPYTLVATLNGPFAPPLNTVATQSQAETLVPSQRSQLQKNIDNLESTITPEQPPDWDMQVEEPVHDSGSATNTADKPIDPHKRPDVPDDSARIESADEGESEDGDDEASESEDSDDAKRQRRSKRIAAKKEKGGDMDAPGASEAEADETVVPKGKGKRLTKQGSTQPRPPLLKAPDLPLPAVAPASDHNLKDVASVEPAAFNRQSVRATLHCANREHQPVHFDFHVSMSTVSGAIVAYECSTLTMFA
jgi:hypothetical protein